MQTEENVCRTCLGARHSGISQLEQLFAPPIPGKPPLPQMLEQVALVQVVENDGLPSVICSQCVQSTLGAFSFKQLCQDSDTKLRNYHARRGSNSSLDESECTVKAERQTDECPMYRMSDLTTNDKIMKSLGGLKEPDDFICDSIETQLDVQPLSAISFNVKDEFGHGANIPDILNKNIDLCTPLIEGKIVKVNRSNLNCNVKNEIFDVESEDGFVPKSKKSTKRTSRLKSTDDVEITAVKVILEPTYPCSECTQQFVTIKELKRHVKADHDKKKSSVVCNVCNQTFAYKQTLSRHMKIHQVTAKNKLCTFCGKSFLRADDLKRHTRIHTGERPYCCDQCPKKYKQSSELKDHVKSHSEAKCYVCTECGKSLATRNGLYIHMKVHRGEKNWECKFCGKKYVTNGELNSHINHIHSKEKPFLCFYTGCLRAFTTNLSLKTHLRAHSGERLFKCTVCGKCLATSSSLHEHKRIHTGEKPKKCNICEKRLGNSQALKKHMRLHTGERPYQCVTCYEKFICSSTLSAHIKIKHMEKQHRCTVCQKMFALGTKLRQHMRLHSDKKMHKCDLCNMTFSNKSKLYQHTKVHENERNTDGICMEENKPQIPSDIIVPMAQLNMPNTLSQYIM